MTKMHCRDNMGIHVRSLFVMEILKAPCVTERRIRERAELRRPSLPVSLRDHWVVVVVVIVVAVVLHLSAYQKPV